MILTEYLLRCAAGRPRARRRSLPHGIPARDSDISRGQKGQTGQELLKAARMVLEVPRTGHRSGAARHNTYRLVSTYSESSNRRQSQ